MFITIKRHELELADAVAKAIRLNSEILGGLPEAVFLLDGDNHIRAPISRSLEALFRRHDLLNLDFQRLLESMLSAKSFAAAVEYLRKVHSGDHLAEINASHPLRDVSARILAADGSVESKYLSFTFRRLMTATESQQLVVAVSDVSQRMELTRELEELRAYSKTQGACLASMGRVGPEGFAAFLRQGDASMHLINAVLKKPARTSAIFRDKLEEILVQVVQLKQEATSLELESISTLARAFEESLIELKGRGKLSGTDFLPLAVRLDELFAQLALMRSMTSTIRSASPSTGADAVAGTRMTDNGTQIIEAPKFAEMFAEQTRPQPVVSRTAPAGSLESALLSLTEHVAQAHEKSVSLTCKGLAEVPTAYQGLVKNIVVQLIRNAVFHGVETPEERLQAGKSSFGLLQLEFEALEDGSFGLFFEDDGRGLDAKLLRDRAITQGLITAEQAEKLPDRKAIKLIFKTGFTTIIDSGNDAGRGKGMAMLRRYVVEAGGRIVLSTLIRHNTRFRVSLPALAESQVQSQVA